MCAPSKLAPGRPDWSCRILVEHKTSTAQQLASSPAARACLTSTYRAPSSSAQGNAAIIRATPAVDCLSRAVRSLRIQRLLEKARHPPLRVRPAFSARNRLTARAPEAYAGREQCQSTGHDASFMPDGISIGSMTRSAHPGHCKTDRHYLIAFDIVILSQDRVEQTIRSWHHDRPAVHRAAGNDC